LFAVGTSRFGIADLETFRQQAPKFQAHELDRLVGPYPEAAATYRARSPLHTVDRIARPVLLVHGLEDAVVPPSQAQVMAEALARRGVRHVLLAFPGEGHGFRRPESIRRALEAELSFLSMLKRWGWRPVSPVPRPPPMARSRPARPISGQTGRSLIRRSSRPKGHLHPCLSGVHPIGSDGGADCSPWLLLLRQLGPLRPTR
jgi:acetyl esterase/lipase